MASGRTALPRAPPFIDPPGYARHRPEETLLYRLVEEHYPALLAAREAADRTLPKHVQAEFAAYLKCGRFEPPLAQRKPHDELIEIGASYYDALDDNNGELAPFAPDCERHETA